MTNEQIHYILDHHSYPGEGAADLIETHISWVILTRKHAFKIKKPLKFSFLDFSTLELRKHYCQEELVLNNRLSSGIYLDVLEVRASNGQIEIGGTDGEVIDYAVQMKRLNTDTRMDLMLHRGQVRVEHVHRIARQLIDFHQTARIIQKKIDPQQIIGDFRDLASVEDFLEEKLGSVPVKLIHRSIEHAEKYIDQHSQLMQKRSDEGFYKDCHGDLHTGNIFLLTNPVIFDCIEFNEDFRQIDVLNEVAFFCMDLEKFDRKNLSRAFLDKYLTETNVMRNAEEERLFIFYKLYRANIKAKVQAIKAQQAGTEAELKKRLVNANAYLHLMSDYLSELKL